MKAVQAKIVKARLKSLVGTIQEVLVEGVSPESDYLLTGRMASQAPDIDSCVYLTDADPSALPPGSLLDGTIVGSREYDLVVRPLPAVDCG